MLLFFKLKVFGFFNEKNDKIMLLYAICPKQYNKFLDNRQFKFHSQYIYIYVSLGSSPSWATRTPHCWIMGATPIHSPTRTSSQASRAVWHVPRTNLMKPRPRVTTTTTRASWCGRAGVYGHGVCNPGLSPSDCWGRDVRGISRGPDDPVMYEEYRFQE